ncbi:MAG: hypothetical protein KF878_18145 [Planctomycetes bacterium]|nr:hypothetical protein [Planctomycetota bacterium]
MSEDAREEKKPRPVPPPAVRNDLPIDVTSGRRGTRCPFCAAALGRGTPISRCAGCGARWHMACLAEGQARGCPVCQGTVFAEDIAGRYVRRLATDAREARLRAIAVPVGAVVGVLALPLSCILTMVLVRVLGLEGARDFVSGASILLIIFASLAIPLGAAAGSVMVLRRLSRPRRRVAPRPLDGPS